MRSTCGTCNLFSLTWRSTLDQLVLCEIGFLFRPYIVRSSCLLVELAGIRKGERLLIRACEFTPMSALMYLCPGNLEAQICGLLRTVIFLLLLGRAVRPVRLLLHIGRERRSPISQLLSDEI